MTFMASVACIWMLNKGLSDWGEGLNDRVVSVGDRREREGTDRTCTHLCVYVCVCVQHRNNYVKMSNPSSTVNTCSCGGVQDSSCDKWDLELMLFFHDGCFVTTKNPAPHLYFSSGYNAFAVCECVYTLFAIL